jgi:hypothetical protein
MEKATPEHMLPDRLLMAALPFVPTHGFTSEAILAGVDSEPELARLEITSWTLSGLFPSTTAKAATVAGLAGRAVPRSEPIGPSKALAERWIQEGNSRMMASVKNEQLAFKLHGLVGVRRAFEIRLAYNRTIPKEFLLNVSPSCYDSPLGKLAKDLNLIYQPSDLGSFPRGCCAGTRTYGDAQGPVFRRLAAPRTAARPPVRLACAGRGHGCAGRPA